MKRVVLALAPLLLLTGCLFSIVNQPVVLPTGGVVAFVDEQGAYNLFPEWGSLVHISSVGEVQTTSLVVDVECGGLACSNDGKELVFLALETVEPEGSERWEVRLAGVDEPSCYNTVISSQDPILDPAFTRDGDVTFLRLDGEDSGTLMLWGRNTEASSALLGDVISYKPVLGEDSFIVMRIEREAGANAAVVSRYAIPSGESETLASFFLSQTMLESLLALPAMFFWDFSPLRDSLALALYDQVLISPQPEGGDPSLYIVDVASQWAEKIAEVSYAPLFSPSGSLLAYIDSGNGEERVVRVYDERTGETSTAQGVNAVSSLFWIGEETLGLVEEEEDGYRLIKLDLPTGKLIRLLD